MIIKHGKKTKLTILDDGSIINNENKILYFSLERFMNDIVLGNCCFICGAKQSDKEFNEEHVLPDWIIKRFKLGNKIITLTNKTPFKYSNYKIPCCIDCNSLMGKEIEAPMSKITSNYNTFKEYMKKGNPWLVFVWLNLIFLKTYLKDKELRLYRDLRKPSTKLSEMIIWEEMHHIHCIARSFYSGCELDKSIFGSTFVGPTLKTEDDLLFDYGDVFQGAGISIVLDEIAIVSILNDSCGALNLFQEEVKKITGELTILQVREILSRLTYININIKSRPRFSSNFNKDNEYVIKADLPKTIDFKDSNKIYGDLLYMTLGEIIENSNVDNKKFILEHLKNGTYTFLFKDGKFINNK